MYNVFFAVIFEVYDAKEVQVRCIVPFIWERGGNWDFSAEENLEAVCDVAEVWKANNYFLAYA